MGMLCFIVVNFWFLYYLFINFKIMFGYGEGYVGLEINELDFGLVLLECFDFMFDFE